MDIKDKIFAARNPKDTYNATSEEILTNLETVVDKIGLDSSNFYRGVRKNRKDPVEVGGVLNINGDKYLINCNKSKHKLYAEPLTQDVNLKNGYFSLVTIAKHLDKELHIGHYKTK